MILSDAQERLKALNTEKSFIVQAPAGAGKTELLIQRFLVLLARVGQPEEVLAITFTRKAAAEMRSRILSAIEDSLGPEPNEAHEQKTWSLARAVMLRDKELGWSILNNPGRLRVQTIDSFCAYLSRQMPWLSRFGTEIELVEYADEYYRQAARYCLQRLGRDKNKSLEVLLMQRDNDVGKLENLLVTMLRKRDQWLRHDYKEETLRDILDTSLRLLTQEAVEKCEALWPARLRSEMTELVAFASQNLRDLGQEGDIASFAATPSRDPETFVSWKAMVELFLKASDGEPRKVVNVKQGFPKADKTMPESEQDLCTAQKSRFKEVYEVLLEERAFVEALNGLRGLPPSSYGEQQWAVLKSTFELLRHALAELRVVFSSEGKTDFVEVALAADTALGAEGRPSDLALSLDYQIQHILVDEFQDTSFTQFRLLERLIDGWELNDGRTLFLVGDPMQSIYRFREAEVGLFLKVQEEGLGSVQLDTIRLNTNFRSTPNLVEWVNEVFEDVLPRDADLLLGKVPFAASNAHKDSSEKSAVVVHQNILQPDAHEQARRSAAALVALIKEERRAYPENKIAVLVRSRAHLKEILPAMQRAKFAYKAVDIDLLAQRPTVQDLWALTRALFHLADRPAWLAILRAPWCGLELGDLYTLCAEEKGVTLWQLLEQEGWKKALPEEAASRLQGTFEVLQKAIGFRGRISWEALVRTTWCLLGGPSLCNEDELSDAMAYLDLLSDCCDQNDSLNTALLAERIENLYAQPNPQADDSLQIMTIHKAKGLEFDTVILPCLERKGMAAQSDLLLWLEKSEGRHSGLLLGTMGDGEEADPVYDYLKDVNKKRERFENARLLYVAMTRAKERVHLFADLKVAGEGNSPTKPEASSLLAHLWEPLREKYLHDVLEPPENEERRTVEARSRLLKRRTLAWEMPEMPASVEIPREEILLDDETLFPQFDWAGERARHVGVLTHQMLKIIADDGLEQWDGKRLEEHKAYFSEKLCNSGVVAEELERAVADVHRALSNVIEDDKGRWILQKREGAYNEKAFAGLLNGRVRHVVIDRTFVDDEDVRWVIDYKLSVHRGADVDAFVSKEVERYSGQLNEYGRLLGQYEDRPIALGLYFPLLKAWRHLPFVT